MNTADIVEILKVAGIGYLAVDVVCFMYVWFWKELHYTFRILLFYVPFTGLPLFLGDYKKMFREWESETRRFQSEWEL